MRAEAWQAVAYLILGGAAVVGGGWGFFTHRRSRRADAARWVTQNFNDFYRDTTLIDAREVFEYDYWEHVCPTVELRVTDRHVMLSPDERSALRSIDLILNYFEQLLYLEEEGHIAGRDREAFFSYWMGILCYPSRAGLRRYLVNCGYERCAKLAHIRKPSRWEATNSELCCLPAELRQDLPLRHVVILTLPLVARKGVADLLQEGSGDWAVYEVGPHQWPGLDANHRYDAQARTGGPARRVCLPVETLGLDVWFYVSTDSYNRLPILLPGAGGGFDRHRLLCDANPPAPLGPLREVGEGASDSAGHLGSEAVDSGSNSATSCPPAAPVAHKAIVRSGSREPRP